MKPQMKSVSLSLLALAILASGTIACTKKSDSDSSSDAQQAQAPAAPAPKIELRNATTSEVVEAADGKFLILPPAVEMNGISVANNPVKSVCKDMTKLKLEISRLEEEKARYIEIAEVDNSAEQGVDEVAMEIELKGAQLLEMQSATAPAYPVYDKEEMLKNIDALKAANPAAVFEIVEPKTALVTIENSNRKASASQTIDLSKAKLEGTFASQDRSVKMTLNLTYEILCSYRDLKKSAGNDQKVILTLK